MAAVTGSFTGTGTSATFSPGRGTNYLGSLFGAWLRGTFVGTVVLQRSVDGTNFVNVSKPDFTDASFTAPVTFSVQDPGSGQYRWNCTAYTSGTINYGMQQ